MIHLIRVLTELTCKMLAIYFLFSWKIAEFSACLSLAIYLRVVELSNNIKELNDKEEFRDIPEHRPDTQGDDTERA